MCLIRHPAWDDREKKTSSILPRKRETSKEQERVVAKSRSGKNCRGNHLRMGIGKKLLGVERESRVQRSVFVPFSSIVFPSTLQCICTVEAWRDWCTEPSSGEKGKKRRELGFGRPQCSCHRSKWNNYQLLRLDAPSALIIYNGIKREDVISWKGFL